MKNTDLSVNTSLSIKQSLTWKVIKPLIKTGIIKSNSLAMFAGLSLAIHINNLNFLDAIPIIIIALIGTSLVVGGSGAINNFYDKDIDSVMERTLDRPTVDGTINPKFALWLGIFLIIIGITLLYSISSLSALMGFLGFFFYVFPYTIWTKRKTIYNTEVGSISGAIPPLIGWSAISPEIFHPVAIGLFILLFLWQPPHFYAIAIRRLKDYQAAGVPMLPVIKGIQRTKVQTIVYIVLLLFVSFLFFSFSKVITFTMLGLTLFWLLLGILGFKKKEDQKWATIMFIYSINHISIIFTLMIIVSFIK